MAMSLTRWTVFIGVFVILPASVLAQAKRPVTMVDLLDVPVLTDPRLSPDSPAGTVCPRGGRWDANKRVSHIWRVNSDGSSTTRMTNGDDGGDDPALVAPTGLRLRSCLNAAPLKRLNSTCSPIRGRSLQLTSHRRPFRASNGPRMGRPSTTWPPTPRPRRNRPGMSSKTMCICSRRTSSSSISGSSRWPTRPQSGSQRVTSR